MHGQEEASFGKIEGVGKFWRRKDGNHKTETINNRQCLFAVLQEGWYSEQCSCSFFYLIVWIFMLEIVVQKKLWVREHIRVKENEWF